MTKLRLLSFIAGVNLVSWGTLLAFSGVSDRSPALIGTAISLIAFSPLVSAALLRLLNRESWENAGLKLRLQEQKAWYGFGVGFPILVIGSILLLSILLGTGSVTYTSSTLISALKLAGITFVPMFIASIGEEFGWRGVALPLLQRKMSPFWAGLTLGIIWAAWHIPAFLLSGTAHSAWSFVPFFGGVVAISVTLTPLFNSARGSFLIAYLYHFQMMNPIWPDAQPWDNLLFAIVAVIIVVLNRETMFKKGTGVTEVLMPEEIPVPEN